MNRSKLFRKDIQKMYILSLATSYEKIYANSDVISSAHLICTKYVTLFDKCNGIEKPLVYDNWFHILFSRIKQLGDPSLNRKLLHNQHFYYEPLKLIENNATH
jgi:hypothetical protein